MAMMDCSTAMGIIAICVLCGTSMVTIVLYYVLKRYTAEDTWESSGYGEAEMIKKLAFDPRLLSEVLPRTVKLKLEEQLICICGKYGQVSAHHLLKKAGKHFTLCFKNLVLKQSYCCSTCKLQIFSAFKCFLCGITFLAFILFRM